MAVYFIPKQGKWRAQIGSAKNRKTCSFSTQAQAKRWEAEQLKGSEDVDQTTWNDLADLYWLDDRFRDKTEKTKKGERTHSLPVLKHFGKMLVVTTDDIVIDDYRQQRRRTISPSSHRQISGNTIRLELAFLSSLVRIALKRRIIRDNPLKLVDKPKCELKKTRISNQDLVRIFQGMMETPFYVYFMLLYSIGCRASELAELTLNHVNLKAKQVYFPDTKNTNPRTVVLPDNEFSLLVRWLKRADRDKNCPYAFPSWQRKKQCWGPFDFSGYWATRKRQLAGTIDSAISPHTFRHERISRWFESGKLNEGMIMELSGHKTAAALNRYRHIFAERLRPVVTEILQEDEAIYLETFNEMHLAPVVEDESHSPDFEQALSSL